MKKRIVVIGGGAAGLFAAIQLGRALPGEVLLLERTARVGKKLLATGNGRCNLSNAHLDNSRFHTVAPQSRARMEQVLAQFDGQRTLDFFASIGVVSVEEERGKMYPASGQASAVLDLMRIECQRAGVLEQCGGAASSVTPLPGGFSIEIEGEKPCQAEVVLLAAGSCASPSLGSDGSGYALAQALGHSMTATYPAIVPIETQTTAIRSLKGCKCQAEVSLMAGEDCLRTEQGELLFTEYGLSGPPVLQLAEALGAAQQRHEQRPLALRLNLLPHWTADALRLALQIRLAEQGYRSINDFLTGWLPKQVARALCKDSGISDMERLAYSLGADELNTLADRLQGWNIPAKGNRSFEKAQVCAGGLRLDEWDETLQSRHRPGLFAAGEILDVHGDSGGYNLQWAWSSAFVASQGMLSMLL